MRTHKFHNNTLLHRNLMTNLSDADKLAKQLCSAQSMNDKEINSFIAEQIRSADFLKVRGFSDEFISNLADEIKNLD